MKPYRVRGVIYKEDLIVLGGCFLVIVLLILLALTVPAPFPVY